MKTVCEVCGNKKDSMSLLCPFCGSKSEIPLQSKEKEFIQKTVNLEAGRPIVEFALQRMHETIVDAKLQGVTVLTIIHGYGSSGKGGAIRTECRKNLEYMRGCKLIEGYVFGEEFHQRSKPVKGLLGRFPQLKTNRNLNKANKGITLVFLG